MKQTIMIVDDSPTVLKFVSYSLKNSGFKVITASDGMDALEKISSIQEHVDMVITDLNMPNMDGYELISTLRQNERFNTTPIIILSSEEDDADRQKGSEAGASAYLTKPFKSSVLLYEVSKFLS
ncbi:MAG: response regulator [candidate division Zixibacteria bacterium]|jgi:two-component system chemotaxis response regulator CheY|nr:response regulator [candidate division Zixibacteria bacterium]